MDIENENSGQIDLAQKLLKYNFLIYEYKTKADKIVDVLIELFQ